MKYVVTVNGRRVTVSVDAGRVSVDNATVEARLDDVAGTPIRILTVGDRVHRVVARQGERRGEYRLWVDGFRYDVEALDERSRAIRDLSTSSDTAAGARPLIAPMPGLVVRVRVLPGDSVVAGQGLVVMEAMKMENELRAGGAGRVKAVLVSPGTAVEKGATLVELE